jgi:hypothetical protein
MEKSFDTLRPDPWAANDKAPMNHPEAVSAVD